MILTRLITRAILPLVAFLLLGSAALAQEMRVAVITVFDTHNSTTAIQNQINRIAALNYNAIAVHARYRGDATYFPNKTNSTYPNNEPRRSSAGSVDVLQEFVTRGHAKNLKVFAYVNAFLVTDGSNTHSSSNHVINTNPGWVTYAYNNGNPVVQTTSHDGEGKWIDPGIPAARNYITNICRDIIANYNVDGIMLDRIRYPQTAFTRTSKDFGYHPTAISRYRQQYGGSGTPSPSASTWITWRQAQIQAMVQEVHDGITAIKPAAQLLAYPLGRYNDAVNYNYQNWPAWMSANKIDAVFPQIYSTSNSDFQTRVTEHRSKYSGSRLLGVAIHGFASGINVNGQITIARNGGLVGISPYRHGTMESLGYNNSLTQRFGSFVSWPAMPWKSGGGGGGTYTVDNTDAGFSASGSWWTATVTSGYYGSNYHTRGTAAVSDSAAWTFTLPAGGSYRVDARWTSGGNRAPAAPYIIYHTGGQTTVNTNQQTAGGQWNSLGTYNFASGTDVRVRLSCWTTTGYYVVADAVRLVQQ